MDRNKIPRRSVTEIRGSAALTILMTTSETLISCVEGKKKRVVSYCTGTGRQLADKKGETLSIPQIMRKKMFEIETDEIEPVYPIYGYMARRNGKESQCPLPQ